MIRVVEASLLGSAFDRDRLLQPSAGRRIFEIAMRETSCAQRQQQKQRTEIAWQMNSLSARTATSLEED
jgi:hypothetical protein